MEEVSYEWEFSWFWATVIVGPAILLLIIVCINAARKEAKKYGKEQISMQKRDYRITEPKSIIYPNYQSQKGSQESIELILAKKITEAKRQEQEGLKTSTKKKLLHIDEITEAKKEGFLGSILGRVPREQ